MHEHPLSWIDDELRRLEAAGLRRRLRVRQGAQTPTAIWQGRELLNFGSNDYLGLAAGDLVAAVRRSLDGAEDETRRQTPHEAAGGPGWGAGASPLVTGRGVEHALLEEELARFEQVEAALLFSSGYAANVGTIAALVGKGDFVYSDAKNHASIVDGCRLSGATIGVYPHSDMAALDSLLRRTPADGRRLIVTDTLFSMDGDLAPMVELAELAGRHRAMLLVDEAHATGVFGRHGRGVCELLDVESAVHVRIGTLSKALGSIGGFVAGSRALIDWLSNRARPYVFSTAPPAATAVAALEALRRVRDEPWRRRTLLERADDLRRRLRADGWNVGRSQSQIIPVVIGQPDAVMRLADRLQEEGCFVPGIRPPSVPAGESLLRISLRADHTPPMIDRLLLALRRVAGR